MPIARILLAEDSPTTRSMVVSALELIGDIEVVPTSSGFEALKTLPRFKFDLIITDVNMPDINGLELVSFVKHNPMYRHIPVIIITSETGEKDEARGRALGAAEYVHKPLNPDTLQQVIRRYIRVD
ncbi:MAG: response regulator [Deltaproteobacteria bacterium]|nr:response regulator [Deltaproteobacteria bacterium]